MEPSRGKGSSQMREAGQAWSSGRWREEVSQGPMGKELGPGKEKGQDGIHLSLGLHLSLPRPSRGHELSKAR